jgi:FtsX-like permease family
MRRPTESVVSRTRPAAPITITARAAAASAAWGLRAHRGTAALLVVAMALSLAAVLCVATLGRAGATGLEPRVMLPAGPAMVDEGWALARSAASIQAEAIDLLFGALVGAAGATFAVGALAVLTLSGARGAERGGELALRRAVGASRGALLVAALLEGAAIAGAALLLGLAAGIPAARAMASAWPGPLAPGALLPPVAASAMSILVVLAGAVLALIFAPRRRLTEVPARPLGLVGPTVQLGLALVILTASALMVRHASSAPSGRSRVPSGGEIFQGASADARAALRSGRYAALLHAVRAGGEFDTVSLTGAGAVIGLGTVSIATTDW